MKIQEILAKSFEGIPEIPLKNRIRRFLSFNKIIPSFISNISPLKGYELYYSLKIGDIVVDAGAYPGDYTTYAARKVGKEGLIICFEPDPKNRKILKKNLYAEKLNNVIIIPKGLWSKNTLLKFKKDNLSSRISLKEGRDEIQVITLDEELKKQKIKKIDVLKMDIEGAEVEAIKGCKKTLINNKVKVAIASYHIINKKTTSKFIENFLSAIGYSVKTNFPGHLTTYAWKNE